MVPLEKGQPITQLDEIMGRLLLLSHEWLVLAEVLPNYYVHSNALVPSAHTVTDPTTRKAF